MARRVSGIQLESVEWNFKHFHEWREEKDQVMTLDIKGDQKQINLQRVATFIVQSLDYLADPTVTERKIPVEIFEICEILSNKIKGSDGLEFFML